MEFDFVAILKKIYEFVLGILEAAGVNVGPLKGLFGDAEETTNA